LEASTIRQHHPPRPLVRLTSQQDLLAQYQRRHVNALDVFVFGLKLTRKRQPIVLQPVMYSSFCDKLGTGSVVSVTSLSLLFYPNFIDAEKHSEYHASPTILSLLYIPYTFPPPLPHLSPTSHPHRYPPIIHHSSTRQLNSLSAFSVYPLTMTRPLSPGSSLAPLGTFCFASFPL
jgi:hypothetical protein